MKPTNKPATPTTSLGNGKIFDVARPGHSLASPTSKPAIVGHKPQVQDPMMARDIDDERRLLGGHDRVTVAPLSATVEAPTSDEPEPANPEPATPASEEALPQPEVPPQVVEETPPPEVPGPTDSDEASQEPIAQEPPANVEPPEPATPPAEPQPQPVRQTKLDALPDEDEAASPDTLPTAVVSHHHHSAGALKNVLVALLILLIVGAIIFDILLDAGFVIMNIPHTHFFST